MVIFFFLFYLKMIIFIILFLVEMDSFIRLFRRCDCNDFLNKLFLFCVIVIVVLFINKLYVFIVVRKGGKSLFLEGDDVLWVGDFEYIYFICRFWKLVVDMNY